MLEDYEKLVVQQKVEKLEVFTGIETKNKYSILTDQGKDILFAYEESNWFSRVLLKQSRPLLINFIDNNKNNFLKIEKKFAFFFPEFSILNSDNQLIAKVKTRFGLNSRLEVYDNNNQLVFFLKNQVMHPWTFNIYKSKSDENSIALISKKFSGLSKEFFTNADNFVIDFNQIKTEEEKKIILALSLIIDLFVFESR